MNWDAIGAAAELLGAAAVFASLIYLAVQTRQNTQALRSAAFHQVRASFSEVSLALSKDSELLSIIARSVSGEAISEAEQVQLFFLYTTMTRRGESAFFQSKEGTLQTESWLGIRSALLGFLANPRGIEWLEGAADRYTKEYIEDLLSGARQMLHAQGHDGR